MGKFTEGPWTAQHTNVMAGRDCLANSGGRTSNRDPDATRIYEENIANAQLMAFAPELLAALEADEAFFAHWDDCTPCAQRGEMCGKAKELYNTAQDLRLPLIVKIRGETP